MSKLNFRIDLPDKDIASDIEDAINKGIEDTMGMRAARGLEDRLQNAARGRIRAADRVWRGVLLDSFDSSVGRDGDDWVLIFENDAEHARTIDMGRTPGDEPPPLEELIPWVESQMDDWNIDPDYGSGGDGVPIADGGQYRLPDNYEVEDYQTAEEAGLEESTASDSIFVLEYENGEQTVFKSSENAESISDFADDRNEEAFTSIEELLGLGHAPETRVKEHEIDGETLRGVETAYIEDHVAFNELRAQLGNDEAAERFAEEIGEITAVDTIVSNSDRHGSNLLIDDRGELWAIDNGGHSEDPNTTVIPPEIRGLNAMYSERSDQMYEAVQETIEAQNRVFDQMVENPRPILDRLQRVHGPTNWRFERAREFLIEDVESFRDRVEQLQQEWLDSVDPDKSVTFDDEPSDLVDDIDDGPLGDIQDEFEDL
jgi:hypothetical protein